MTTAIDSVRQMEVTSYASRLLDGLVDALVLRVQILLGTDEVLPCGGGRSLSAAEPTEFVIAAYLNAQFSAAIEA